MINRYNKIQKFESFRPKNILSSQIMDEEGYPYSSEIQYILEDLYHDYSDDELLEWMFLVREVIIYNDNNVFCTTSNSVKIEQVKELDELSIINGISDFRIAHFINDMYSVLPNSDFSNCDIRKGIRLCLSMEKDVTKDMSMKINKELVDRLLIIKSKNIFDDIFVYDSERGINTINPEFYDLDEYVKCVRDPKGIYKLRPGKSIYVSFNKKYEG